MADHLWRDVRNNHFLYAIAVISFMEEAERKKMRIVTNPNSNHCSAVYNISKMGFFGGNIT